MKKGVIIKNCFPLTLILLIMITPFSFVLNAEGYVQNPYIIGAFNHFLNRGMRYSLVSTSDNYINFLFRDLEFTNTGYLSSNTNDEIEVYNRNWTRLGLFKGWEDDPNASGPMIYYITDSGVEGQCHMCYISIKNSNYTLINNKISISDYNDLITINGEYRDDNLYRKVTRTYTSLGSYNYSKADYIYPNQDQRFIFAVPSTELSVSGANLNNSISIYYPNNSNFTITTQTTRIVSGGLSFYIIKFNNVDNVSNWFNFDIGALNGNTYSNIIPMWWGDINKMDSDLYATIFGNLDISRNQLLQQQNDLIVQNNTLTSTTNTLLTTNNTLTTNTNILLNDLKSIFTNGDNQTQSNVNTSQQQNQEINDSFSDLDDLEGDLVNDMSTNLNAIDTSLNLRNETKFVSGANYIKQQIDWITANVPSVNLIITYSLILGLAALIIGKRLL